MLLTSNIDDCSSYWQSESHSCSHDNVEEALDDEDELIEEEYELSEDSLECSIIKNERKQHTNSQMFINKKISKFFVNVDQENELEDDFDTDELEAISEDEQIDDVSDLLYENNKKFSQQHASNIKQQMKVMGRLYHQMTGSLEQNFASVQNHI